MLDDAAAPGAAGDREPDRGDALAVEPAAPDAVGGIAQHADAVDGVLGRDDDAVAAAQLGLLDRLGEPAVLHDGVHRPGAGDHPRASSILP